MAREEETIIQAVLRGPRERGSLVGSVGGKGWRLRGRIWDGG